MKRKLAVISISVVIFVGAFVALRTLTFEKETTIGQILAENGFVEIKPPSTLVQPGTWMTVLRTNPFHLNIVCPPENSLGLTGVTHLRTSLSIDTKLMSKLRNRFSFGIDALSSAQGKMASADIKNISFQLKNIRVLELPDDVVFQGVQKRAIPCRDAIRFRLQQKEAISMVKSVLIADVDYRVEFTHRLSAEAEAEVRKKVALDLDLRLSSGQDGLSTIVGRDLIWGIRSDENLASFGLNLPSTGGLTESNNILSKTGSVEKIIFEQNRQKFPLEDVVASLNVQPLRQPSPMSCWATVYAMMKSWKEQKPISVTEAVSQLGAPWDDYYLSEKGLPGGEEKAFVKAIKMRSEPPANYGIEAYVEMLRERGPLWIITGDGISSHARLLIGIYGDWKAVGIDAYKKTVFEFIDPLTGTHRYESGLEFSENFEKEARFLVERKLDDVRFRDQILTF